MEAFATLLDRLVLTPSRNAKLRLLIDYFHQTPDPDRGFAIAAIAGDLKIQNVKPALLRALVEERMDPVLFGYSYDYVGDMAETISLVWPEASQEEKHASFSLGKVVADLQNVSRSGAPNLVASLLDELDPSPRWALLKLITRGLRIGVSARLLKQALADFGKVDVTEIEELWHGLEPPYENLFSWLEGRAEKPVSAALASFRPVMLAHALEEADYSSITPQDYAAEWKWDGIRVQLVGEGGVARLYSRTGDDISHAFPDILESVEFDAALDGELLIRAPGETEDGLNNVGSFSDLQQRLNRKVVTKKHLEKQPAFIRVYDLLHLDDENLRPLPFQERRRRLEEFIQKIGQDRIDISPLVPFGKLEELAEYRAAPPHPEIEGLMLKQWDSDYKPGRAKGPWYKWKKDPYIIDAVLMYAQRGHGKRSSFYSDYTFGVWVGEKGSEELVPVGKAYFGFTDEELKEIDKFVRNNTVERFGPVRSVRAELDHGLVFEVAFEGLNRSTRHKSGVAMRFPRISRLRWDKPPAEADRLEALEALLS